MPRLQIDLKPSLWLASVLVAGHLLALAAAWLSLEDIPRYLVLCGVALSAVACLSEILHWNSGAAVSLELFDDGRAAWRDRRERRHEGRLGDGHFVSTGLVVMKLDLPQGRRKWLVLAADSGVPEDLRRLRVWLRWHRESVEKRGEAGTGFE